MRRGFAANWSPRVLTSRSCSEMRTCIEQRRRGQSSTQVLLRKPETTRDLAAREWSSSAA